MLEPLEPRVLLNGAVQASLLPPIPQGDVRIELRTVVTGLSGLTALMDAGDGSGRLFAMTVDGSIRILRDGALQPDPFLDLTARTVTGGERGLLGLAFHPRFAEAGSLGFGTLYTYGSERVSGRPDFTTTLPLPPGIVMDHQGVLTEWRVDPANPDRVDPASAREILRIDEPQSNHNGGAIAFGPDGYLYLSLGDGGAGSDVGPGHSLQGNAQDLSNVYGSILRIDVSGAGGGNGRYGVPADNPFVGVPGLDEIYAYGLRNPWRMSFDPLTGDLYAGDVGQSSVEELNHIVRGGNYGWPLKEGSFAYNRSTGAVSPDTGALPPGLVDPLFEYDHEQGRAVIMGYVYRGQSLPEIEGRIVFGDLLSANPADGGRVFYADRSGSPVLEFGIEPGDRPLGEALYSFGRDANGELYLLTGAGNAYEIVRPSSNPLLPPRAAENLFDERSYLRLYPDVALAVMGGQFVSGGEHFERFGRSEGRNPSGLFDGEFYLRDNPDVRSAVEAGAFPTAFEHYLGFGQVEGRDPSPLFRSGWYLEANPDVVAAVSAGQFASGLEHFTRFGISEAREPIPLFDSAFYAQQNPDVAQGVLGGDFRSPFEHYLLFGQYESRDPNPLFLEGFYRQAYLDVDAAVGAGVFASGFEHFLEFGQFENRNVSPWYDGAFYAQQNPDVASAVATGVLPSLFEHLARYGQQEGRDPSGGFDQGFYLATYPDVATAVGAGAFESGFEHWMVFGRFEGRRPTA